MTAPDREFHARQWPAHKGPMAGASGTAFRDFASIEMWDQGATDRLTLMLCYGTLADLKVIVDRLLDEREVQQ